MALRIGRCLLRELRKAKKLSQVELAKRVRDLGVDLSDTTVSEFERNERICTNILTLKGISRVLGCHIDDLYEFPDS
ncbi:hypothetical protein VE23_25000 [Paenibacillus sp. D9]|nr:hypothetical protein VE23_25000 [Paenibacillus sp. D9]